MIILLDSKPHSEEQNSTPTFKAIKSSRYLISIFDILLQQINLKSWRPLLKSQVQKYLKQILEFGVLTILNKIEKFSQIFEGFSSENMVFHK